MQSPVRSRSGVVVGAGLKVLPSMARYKSGNIAASSIAETGGKRDDDIGAGGAISVEVVKSGSGGSGGGGGGGLDVGIGGRCSGDQESCGGGGGTPAGGDVASPARRVAIKYSVSEAKMKHPATTPSTPKAYERKHRRGASSPTSKSTFSRSIEDYRSSIVDTTDSDSTESEAEVTGGLRPTVVINHIPQKCIYIYFFFSKTMFRSISGVHEKIVPHICVPEGTLKPSHCFFFLPLQKKSLSHQFVFHSDHPRA